VAAILSFLLTPFGRWAAGAGGVMLMVFAFGAHQRSIGAGKAVAKIEAKTNADLNRADRAARKSAAGGGVRDLPYRD
jgi:hypothetical protein